jgi:hypothetical protein
MVYVDYRVFIFFASAQVVNVGCMCSVIVHFFHCICVCDVTVITSH